MMHLEILHDRPTIRRFLEVDRGRFAYLLGDLDPFFWGRTIWFSAAENDQHRAIILLYLGYKRPVVQVFGDDHEALRWLLSAMTPILPPVLDIHIEQPMISAITELGWMLRQTMPHFRMLLQGNGMPEPASKWKPIWFDTSSLEELSLFYRDAYPDNYFDPRMLETGRYAGCRDKDGAIAAVAGVHVYSPGDSVAVLGNITTHPDYRGQGVGGYVTGALCTRLREDGIKTIALNVFTQNDSAVRLYQRLGFATQLTFTEALAVRGL
jgi:GNAT superfamily N-acetyltransferase